MNTFGKILRWMIAESGLSQRQLAEKGGITQATVSRALRAKATKDLRPTTLQALAKALDMPMAAFMVRFAARPMLPLTREETDALDHPESPIRELDEHLKWFSAMRKEDQRYALIRLYYSFKEAFDEEPLPGLRANQHQKKTA